MADALRAGAQGVEPPPAEVADTATEATRMMTSRQRPPTEATRLMPHRDPTQIAPSRSRPPTRAERRPPARRRGPRLQAVLTALLLLAIAVLIVALLAPNQFTSQPQLRPVTASDPQEAIDQVQDLIEDNTR
jgi:hypothetical protein